GGVWANVILQMVLDASNGTLGITDHLQAQLVTWEVTGLAMLAGSALAGAGTANSLKQGLCVGLPVSAVLLGVRLRTRQAPLPDRNAARRQTEQLARSGAGHVHRVGQADAREPHDVPNTQVGEGPRPGEVAGPRHDHLSGGVDLELLTPLAITARRQAGQA